MLDGEEDSCEIDMESNELTDSFWSLIKEVRERSLFKTISCHVRPNNALIISSREGTEPIAV